MSAADSHTDAQRHPARIQVSSNKKPLYFYVNLAKRLLQEHGEVQLSALGLAVSTMVTVAEILKKDKLAVEKKLTTMLDSIADDGRQRPVQKPKMEIILGKSDQFDQIMAEAAKEQEQERDELDTHDQGEDQPAADAATAEA